MVVDQAILEDLAARLGGELARRGWMLTTAESCTGGWVAQVLTAVAGSSTWFERGFVTYSNAAKQEMLGVAARTLAEEGAVSEAVVREMAAGALERSRAQAALAISGIAGPGGGTPKKPVGTVCFAWALSGRPAESLTLHLSGDRRAIRARSVRVALEGMLGRLAAVP